MVNLESESKCANCEQVCYGEVVVVHRKTFHRKCFTCNVATCTQNLVDEGFVHIDGRFYCQFDYRKLLGRTCFGCEAFVEGNAIEVGDSLYHLTCFNCIGCGVVFPPNTDVLFFGDCFSCVYCYAKLLGALKREVQEAGHCASNKKLNKSYELALQGSHEGEINTNLEECDVVCEGCGKEIKNEHSLKALEKLWHIPCFTCSKCGILLVDEYVGKDGVPYCEKDYQREFGIACAKCSAYISGKVLQAGGKYYHPSCSRCCKCNGMFGEGEEMYVQGTHIWHPHCEELARNSVTESTHGNFEELNGINSNSKDADHELPSLDGNNLIKNKGNTLKPPVNKSNNSNALDHGSDDRTRDRISNRLDKGGETGGTVSAPPPPARTSSKRWIEKYSSGLPAGTGLQITPTLNVRPHSYADASLKDRTDEAEALPPRAADTNSLLPSSVSSASELTIPSHTTFTQKGIGFNKLQYRRSLRASQRKESISK